MESKMMIGAVGLCAIVGCRAVPESELGGQAKPAERIRVQYTAPPVQQPSSSSLTNNGPNDYTLEYKTYNGPAFKALSVEVADDGNLNVMVDVADERCSLYTVRLHEHGKDKDKHLHTAFPSSDKCAWKSTFRLPVTQQKGKHSYFLVAQSEMGLETCSQMITIDFKPRYE